MFKDPRDVYDMMKYGESFSDMDNLKDLGKYNADERQYRAAPELPDYYEKVDEEALEGMEINGDIWDTNCFVPYQTHKFPVELSVHSGLKARLIGWEPSLKGFTSPFNLLNIKISINLSDERFGSFSWDKSSPWIPNLEDLEVTYMDSVVYHRE